jgi:FixJ family two-component response regulator
MAAFASAQEFLAQYDPGVCGCLVLDLAMPSVSGLELQSILAEKGSLLPIVWNYRDRGAGYQHHLR